MELKLFLSSFTFKTLINYKQLRPDSEMNILLSFGTRKLDYEDMVITHRNMINSLICDSGAYTKNNAQDKKTAAKISLDGYISFLRQPLIRNSFDFAFNYDQDFKKTGFETNYRNMKKIEQNVISVVPVVHDYKAQIINEIDYYLKNKYPIIALGFSEDKIKNKNVNISNAVNKIVNGGSKTHLLGISSYDILKDIPVHYCDSSSWAQEGKFGMIIWWNPYIQDENKTDRVYMLYNENSESKKLKHFGNYQYRNQFEKYLKDELNMTITDIEGHDKESNIQLINVHFFVKLQDEIRKAHKRNNIILN